MAVLSFFKRKGDSRKKAKALSSASGKFFQEVARQRQRQLSFSKALGRSPISYSKRTGGRGRPFGSVKYRHPVTGQPIGVYEYRKILSAQLKERKLQAQRNATISPKEQIYLQRMEALERQRQMSPENKIIPDTYGTVNLKTLHDEADDAANLVP